MFSRLAQFPALSISAARFCPHPCGRTCGAGGPQQVAAAPAPPRPAAATSRASASASARHTEGNGTGRGASPQADRERPPQICTGTLPPTTARAHLSRGVGAAGAPGARFPQGATLGLRQEALAVQRGFDKARIAVELHQVEDLRRRRRAVSCRERSASRRERSASRQGSRPGPGAWVHPQLWRRAPSPSLPHAPPPSPSFTVDSRLLSDPRPAPTFNRVPASRFALFPTPPHHLCRSGSAPGSGPASAPPSSLQRRRPLSQALPPGTAHLKLLGPEHVRSRFCQHFLAEPGLPVDVHGAQRLAGQELLVDVTGLLS